MDVSGDADDVEEHDEGVDAVPQRDVREARVCRGGVMKTARAPLAPVVARSSPPIVVAEA